MSSETITRTDLTNILNEVLPQDFSKVGERVTDLPSAKSCSSGRYYQVASVTLSPGIWMIDANAAFAGVNATGIRHIRISAATSDYDNVTTAPTAIGNIAVSTLPGYNVTLYPQVHTISVLTEPITYRLIAYQTSGSAENVTGRFYATRLK